MVYTVLYPPANFSAFGAELTALSLYCCTPFTLMYGLISLFPATTVESRLMRLRAMKPTGRSGQPSLSYPIYDLGLPLVNNESSCLAQFTTFFSELSIFSAMLAGFSFTPSIESAHGYFQHVTHHRHWILSVVISDKLILHSWLREKMLPAFFKMSRSCRTRSNSRLSWWFSSSSGI